MRLRRTWRDKPAAPTVAPDDEELVTRDAEESIVAALHESDTAVDAMHDTAADAGRETGDRQRWKIGAAGLALAVLGLLVARRRR